MTSDSSKRTRKSTKKKSLASGLGSKTFVTESMSGVLQAGPWISWKKACVLCALIATVVFGAYLVTLWGGYVYCDYFNLSPLRGIGQESLSHENWSSFWSNLLTNAFVSPLSQPLVKATLAIDMQSATIMSPAVFHCINILLHLGSCVLLFLLTYKLTVRYNQDRSEPADPYVVATCAGALFACHPLTCEAVAYISARSALLITFNYMFALLFFMKGFLDKEITRALVYYLLCIFFTCLAIWSGPQGLTAAGAMLLLGMLLKPKAETWKKWVQDRPLELFAIALFASVVPFVLLLKYVAPIGNGFGLASLPPMAYVATQCKALVTYYLRAVFVPVGLSLDPPYAVATSFADPLAIVGALIPIALLALAWKFRENLLLSFSLGFFVLTMLPDLLIVQPEVFSDRRMYLPLLALCIPVGLLVYKIGKKETTLTIAGCVLLIGTFIGLTNWRCIAWQKDSNLWQGALDMNKESERSRVMMVWSLAKDGKIQEAEKQAREELKQYPDSAILNLVLGKYANATKQWGESQKYYQKALDLADKQNLSPEFIWDIQFGLASAAANTGDMKKAFALTEEIVKIQPNNASVRLIRGKYFLSVDQPQAAFQELQVAHMLDRYNAEVLEPLARAAIGCGEKEHQDVGYEIAKRAYMISNDRKLLLLPAYGAIESGHVYEAMSYIQDYLKTEKPNAELYYLLYGAYKKLGMKLESDEALKLALQSDPNIKKKMRLYLNREVVKPTLQKAPGTPQGAPAVPGQGAPAAPGQVPPSGAGAPAVPTAPAPAQTTPAAPAKPATTPAAPAQTAAPATPAVPSKPVTTPAAPAQSKGAATVPAKPVTPPATPKSK